MNGEKQPKRRYIHRMRLTVVKGKVRRKTCGKVRLFSIKRKSLKLPTQC